MNDALTHQDAGSIDFVVAYARDVARDGYEVATARAMFDTIDPRPSMRRVARVAYAIERRSLHPFIVASKGAA